MPRAYTKAERDRLAGAYYTALHADDVSERWETKPDWQRFKHRRGVDALLDALAEVEADRRRDLMRGRSTRLGAAS